MASITRKQLQEKITNLRKLYPNGDITSQLSGWMDNYDLSNLAFTHQEQRDIILEDLASYEGGIL